MKLQCKELTLSVRSSRRVDMFELSIMCREWTDLLHAGSGAQRRRAYVAQAWKSSQDSVSLVTEQ